LLAPGQAGKPFGSDVAHHVECKLVGWGHTFHDWGLPVLRPVADDKFGVVGRRESTDQERGELDLVKSWS
jgi:hypothetical protein